MSGKMISVYRLREDANLHANNRDDTPPEKWGIKPTYGRFLSEEWWHSIDSGRLQVHTDRGRIAGIWDYPKDFGPMFLFKSYTGSEERFYAKFHEKEQYFEYREGREVEIDYVWIENQKTEYNPQDPIVRRCILEIRLG